MDGTEPVVRAKFRCVSKEERQSFELEDETGRVVEDAQVEVKLQPVSAGTPIKLRRVGSSDQSFYGSVGNIDNENAIFGAATPAGSVALLIKNRAAADKFKVNQAYYVDFTPTEG